MHNDCLNDFVVSRCQVDDSNKKLMKISASDVNEEEEFLKS